MVGWPLFRLIKNLHKRGRLPDMKPVRVTITVSVLAAAIFVFFFVPLPVSRIREAGLVQLQPDAMEKVPVVLPGKPEKVFVIEGQLVERGAELALFTSFAHRREEIKIQSQVNQQETLLKKYQEEITKTTKLEDRETLTNLINETTAQVEKARTELQTISNKRHWFVLRAPRSGVVSGLPRKEELYHPWEKPDLEKPFCQIGNPNRLRILVPVPPDDFALIRHDVDAKKQKGQELDVTIRVNGFTGQTWKGKIAYLPKSADKTVPLQLTTKGGGPLAMRPGTDPNNPEPQGQVYLIAIDFETTNTPISPGTLGQVKIHCEYRSCAWWAWRTIAAAFDLGLW
jgi:putative peptide zinc metalloprotease protein